MCNINTMSYAYGKWMKNQINNPIGVYACTLSNCVCEVNSGSYYGDGAPILGIRYCIEILDKFSLHNLVLERKTKSAIQYEP